MIDFEKMSDKKLKEWISEWEQYPLTRNLSGIDVYTEALKESFKRFNDESYWKIEYFKEHLTATIDDFQMWFREI
jgi:hypothetical protein